MPESDWTADELERIESAGELEIDEPKAPAIASPP